MQKLTKKSRADRVMSGKIKKKQNAKEVQHKKHGKAKNPKEHGQRHDQDCQRGKVPNVPKKFRHQSFLTGFFFKKIQIFSLAS